MANIRRINLEAEPARENDEEIYLKFLTLTEPEKKIMEMVASGLQQKQIAERLGVTVYNVNKHSNNLHSKLNIHDKSDVTRIWMKFGNKTDPLNEEERLS